MMTTEQPVTFDFSFYEQPSTITHFDAILSDLQTDLTPIGVTNTPTAADISRLVGHLLQRQHHYYQHPTDETPARIPMRLFDVETLAKPSPLYTIILAAYTFRHQKKWTLEGSDDEPMFLELVDVIRKQLIQDGFYSTPIIAFDESVVSKDDITEWTQLVNSLGGQVVDIIPSATHIIYNNTEPVWNPEKRLFYVVKDKRADGKSFVHHVGLPESHDEWVTLEGSDVGEETAKPTDSSYPWHVRATWILDSYKHKEWMSPTDYVQNRVNLKREGSALEDSTVTKKAKTPSDPSAIPLLPEEDGQRYLSIQSHDIVIPSYAAWFDITTVHVIESRALPEFFNDRNKSKTPTVYKLYRDFMINTYRMNPVEYLTMTACRRNLTGDVCAILRVHSFLEQWGLINYQVDPEAKLSSLSPPFDSQFKVIVERPMAQNQVKLQKDEDTDRSPKIEEKEEEGSKVEIEEPTTEKTPQSCSSCGTQCTTEQYRSTQKPDLYLCRSCLVEGKYPLNHGNGDFRLETFGEEKEEEEDKWDENEDKLLKEGLEQFGDDWEKISEHVGTRTYNECVLHYLQLPTEDPIDNIELKKLGLLQYDSTEESKENPIMSVVAFLASIVKPKVAATAAEITTAMTDVVVADDSDDKEQKATDDNLYQLTNKLVQVKLENYRQHYLHYESLESIVEQQKRLLEKEKRQLEHDQMSVKKKFFQIHHEMIKRGNSATAIANSITPAFLQQQLAAIPPNTNMFLNPQQQQLQQQQQQQYHLQMQMQLQQQQQLHNQPRHNGPHPPPHPPTAFNNMMPL
ncbi:MAG: hypothetical protein EXX96DRAFT_31588 [Benjaminiella poitrasii]|nr:MAG: hypothetical protein EXX96DRAFT_31588 [Benjaminiella poitrasii]